MTETLCSSLKRFKHDISLARPIDLQSMASGIAIVIANKTEVVTKLKGEITRSKGKLRVVAATYNEKLGRLPVKEYKQGKFVRYRLQSLIYNKCLLPAGEWYVISRRGNIAKKIELIVAFPKRVCTTSFKMRYGDDIAVRRGKLVSCFTLQSALMLMRKGASFVSLTSWYPFCNSTMRTSSVTPGALWIGTLSNG